MSDFLFIDIETRSKVDLKKSSIVHYSNDSSTEIICISYCILSKKDINFKNKPKIKTIFFPKKFKDLPLEIQKFKGKIVNFNFSFEYEVLNNVFKDSNSHFNNTDNYLDTMRILNRFGFTGKLEEIGEFFNRFLPSHSLKLEVGKKLINKFSKPNKDNDFNEIDKQSLKDFGEYCEQDVYLTINIFKIFYPIYLLEEKEEIELDRIDRKVNSNGIKIDLQSLGVLEKSINFFDNYFFNEASKFGVVNKKVLVISSNAEFLNLVNSFSKKLKFSPLENSQEETLKELSYYLESLKDSKDKTKLLEILDLRNFINSKSLKKINAFSSLNYKGRIYYNLRYHYARTGRFSSSGVQIQNLSRNAIDSKEYENKIDDLKKKISIWVL